MEVRCKRPTPSSFATEFIDGDTLRRRIAAGINLIDILDYRDSSRQRFVGGASCGNRPSRCQTRQHHGAVATAT
jgi:hypothetical protein